MSFPNTAALLEVAEKLRHSKSAVEAMEQSFINQYMGVRNYEDIQCRAYEEDGVFVIGTPFGGARAATRTIFEGERALVEYRFLVKIDDERSEEVLRVNLDQAGIFTTPGGHMVGVQNQPTTVREMALIVLAGIMTSKLYQPTPDV